MEAGYWRFSVSEWTNCKKSIGHAQCKSPKTWSGHVTVPSKLAGISVPYIPINAQQHIAWRSHHIYINIKNFGKPWHICHKHLALSFCLHVLSRQSDWMSPSVFAFCFVLHMSAHGWPKAVPDWVYGCRHVRMDANMDARICMFACMPAGLWLCIFKGIRATMYIYMYVHTFCMYVHALTCLSTTKTNPRWKKHVEQSFSPTVSWREGSFNSPIFWLNQINQHQSTIFKESKSAKLLKLFSRSQTSSCGWPAPFSEYWEPMKCSKESNAPERDDREDLLNFDDQVGCKSYMFQWQVSPSIHDSSGSLPLLKAWLGYHTIRGEHHSSIRCCESRTIPNHSNPKYWIIRYSVMPAKYTATVVNTSYEQMCFVWKKNPENTGMNEYEWVMDQFRFTLQNGYSWRQIKSANKTNITVTRHCAHTWMWFTSKARTSWMINCQSMPIYCPKVIP